ncbi:hypothetical protein [Parasphingorhabdus sp.]|jgi:hypothetical protein|uniref:hypothetical protein n=1 Tax=Parasphingorhabdus sp. TaxID=2709688 RepID=UPI0013BE9314
MERHGDEIEISPEEASNIPRKPHLVRYVLAVSLLMAVVAMSLVWIIPALN